MQGQLLRKGLRIHHKCWRLIHPLQSGPPNGPPALPYSRKLSQNTFIFCFPHSPCTGLPDSRGGIKELHYTFTIPEGWCKGLMSAWAQFRIVLLTSKVSLLENSSITSSPVHNRVSYNIPGFSDVFLLSYVPLLLFQSWHSDYITCVSIQANFWKWILKISFVSSL